MTGDSRTDQQLAAELGSLRRQLTDALATLDALERRIVPNTGKDKSAQPEPPAPRRAEPSESSSFDVGPVRTDVLIHSITSPALARSAQRRLASHPGVTRADVRELAEGTLRLTIIGDAPVPSSALDDWEPNRPRLTRSEHPGVLEIELGDEGTDSASM